MLPQTLWHIALPVYYAAVIGFVLLTIRSFSRKSRKSNTAVFPLRGRPRRRRENVAYGAASAAAVLFCQVIDNIGTHLLQFGKRCDILNLTIDIRTVRRFFWRIGGGMG